MSRLLSELLDVNEPKFSIALKSLERSSGNPSVDVRLTAEIFGKVHLKTKALGLDPHDTAAPELYSALLGLIRKHDEFLVRLLGGKDASDVHDLLPRIKNLLVKLNTPKQAWVLKHTVAKKLLKTLPPKKAMKQLGYRSIDSMLKRESVAEIYAAIRIVESPEWQTNFIKKYKTIKSSDFEYRTIEILLLDQHRWQTASKVYVQTRRHNLTHLKELGVIALLPMPIKHMPGVTVTILPLLIHYLNEIRLYSSYFKLQQVRPDFGDIVVRTLQDDPSDHAIMAGQQLHWRVVQRHFGKQNGANHPEIFEPHVQPEDLKWRKAEEMLYRLEPALEFWRDMDYVAALHRGKPVSFNLMDVAISYVNRLPFTERSVSHFRSALWDEIFMRYVGQQTLENQVLRQLDNEMLEPEKLALIAVGRV